MRFSDKLRYLRKKNNYTQAELAKLVNVTQVSIHQWEEKGIIPFRNTQIQLANVLHVNVDDLMNDERSV
jgi:transcriptional regulator with XRE-family HTH domain